MRFALVPDDCFCTGTRVNKEASRTPYIRISLAVAAAKSFPRKNNVSFMKVQGSASKQTICTGMCVFIMYIRMYMLRLEQHIR